MDSEMSRYYQASGKVPFVGTVLMQLFGAVAAAVLGGLYALANWYSPRAFLTIFAVLIFGAGVGFAVNIGAKIGKVRNAGFVMLLGTATGILAVYFAWVVYIHLAFRNMGFQDLWIWRPDFIFKTMQLFAENATGTFTGWLLWACWVMEAGIVILLSLAISVANDTPFCDYCNAWTKKADDVASFPLTDPAALQGELEAERYEVLDELRKSGRPDPSNRLKAVIHSCPNCEDSDYLTISHATVVVDSDGNEETNDTELVKYLRIPRDVTEHLHEMGAPVSYDEDEETPKPEDEILF